MAKKVYAIKEGFDKKNNSVVKDKIVNTWNECLQFVRGVKGAKYKSFLSIKEAEEYLNACEGFLNKEIDEYPQDIPHFYVDGSYNDSNEKYSYGVVMVEKDVIKYIENGSSNNISGKNVRQIAGELKASIQSLKYAAENNIKNIVIIHDYVGVCYHATGIWERKEESSKKYYAEFNDIVKRNDIKVTFVKVDSHTGDLYNEVVDEFAKAAIGVTLQGETKKYLKDNKIIVQNNELKQKFQEIVENQYIDNVIINKHIKKDEDNKEVSDDYIKEIIELIKLDKSKAKKYVQSLDNHKKNELIGYLIDNFRV